MRLHRRSRARLRTRRPREPRPPEPRVALARFASSELRGGKREGGGEGGREEVPCLEESVSQISFSLPAALPRDDISVSHCRITSPHHIWMGKRKKKERRVVLLLIIDLSRFGGSDVIMAIDVPFCWPHQPDTVRGSLQIRIVFDVPGHRPGPIAPALDPSSFARTCSRVLLLVVVWWWRRWWSGFCCQSSLGGGRSRCQRG